MCFKVVVRGNPQPSLTWYHEDSELLADYCTDIQQDGNLSITSAELKHSGVYRLLARNSRGRAEKEVRLTVTQEQEDHAVTPKERVEILPVPVAEFGEYVANNHAHSDEIFKLQYNVCEDYIIKVCHSFSFPGARDNGDEHPKAVGTSKKYVKLNRFANITVCELSP